MKKSIPTYIIRQTSILSLFIFTFLQEPMSENRDVHRLFYQIEQRGTVKQTSTKLDDLKIEDVPLPTEDIARIFSFAHTINGYELTESFEETASIADNPNPDRILELRIALFFCARAFRHVGIHQDSPEMRRLVGQIRDCLKKSQETNTSAQ